MHETFAVWAVNSLKFKSEQSFFKCQFVVFGDHLFAFPPYFFEDLLDVGAVFVNKAVSFFKANPFDRVQIVAARQNTSYQQHFHGKSSEVEFSNFLQVVQIYLLAVAIGVHFVKAFFNSEGQQVTIFCYYHVCETSEVHVCKLSVGFIRCHNVVNVHRNCDLDEQVGHLRRNINSNTKHFVGHHLVALTEVLFGFQFVFFPVSLPFVFRPAFHLESSAVKDQNWSHIVSNQKLQLFLTVLDKLCCSSTVDQLHRARVGALVEPAVPVNCNSLASIGFDVLCFGD